MGGAEAGGAEAGEGGARLQRCPDLRWGSYGRWPAGGGLKHRLCPFTGVVFDLCACFLFCESATSAVLVCLMGWLWGEVGRHCPGSGLRGCLLDPPQGGC